MTAIAAEAAVADSHRSMACGRGKTSRFIRAQFKGSGEERWMAETGIRPSRKPERADPVPPRITFWQKPNVSLCQGSRADQQEYIPTILLKPALDISK
jgi:hypothetical protein